MKLFALFAAVFAQRAENFRQIVNKIPDTFSPTAKTSTFSGAGSIQFTTSSFDKKQENLVLVWSEDGQFSSPFNIIANIRPAHSEFEKFDSEFSDKVSFTFPSDSSVEVSISVDESDSRFFYVLSFSDPFSSSDVTHTGDDFSHRANFYLGELQAGYLDVNTMIAAQQTTNGVLGDNGITVSDDLVYRPATQEELEKIGFQGPGIAVDMPNDDWFAAHRSAEYVTFATDYSSAKLMRPKNKEDVVANTKAVLEGWEVEISCGPIPEGDQSTMEVSIEARTESDEHQSFRAPVSELIVGDKISKKVKVESWHQSTGVWCKFFEGGNLIGYTNPQTFVVNAPAELPAITATYNSPKCGFVGAGAEEEIATCAAASATFPPLFLQWKVIKADGTEELIPAEPKETFSLKLPVVISQEYAGASASCSVYQGTDPALKSAPEFQKSVTPTGSGFSLKKKTSKLDMHVIGRDVTCQSDVFGATTVAEDECSDVQSIEVTNTVNCPLETFYKQATCRIVLVGGGVPLESTYTNEECIAYDMIDANCTESAYKKCPKPDAPEELSELDEGGSGPWFLLFFVCAALGGVLLVYLNKSSPNQSEYETVDAEDKTVDSFAAVKMETEVAPPSAPEVVESVSEPVEPKKNDEVIITDDIPLIDESEKQENSSRKSSTSSSSSSSSSSSASSEKSAKSDKSSKSDKSQS